MSVTIELSSNNIYAIVSNVNITILIVKNQDINLYNADIVIHSPEITIEDKEVLLFPLLVKINKKNVDSYWLQYVKGNEIYRYTWINGGKTVKTFEPAIGQAKNIGKKNEVTPEGDALRIAVFDWDKKVSQSYELAKGYVCKKDIFNWRLRPNEIIAEENKETEDKLRTVPDLSIRPMLAKKFDERYAVFPMGVSTKLDGIRCIAQLYRESSKIMVSLISRTGKPHPHFSYICEAIEKILLEYGKNDEGKLNTILDGELYVHGVPFNEIASIVRTNKNIHKNVGKLQYHIFDVVDKNLPYKERANILEKLQQISIELHFDDALKFVLYTEANSFEDIKRIYAEIMLKGYEGIILRKLDTVYSSTRTTDLMKYKEFEDAEFKIVGVTKSIGGTEDGAAIIEVETPNGNITVRMHGSVEFRRKLYEDRKNLIGKLLTVKYQPSTEKNEKPRFPVGIDIRDYE